MISGCKTSKQESQTQPGTYHINILLTDGTSPGDVNEIQALSPTNPKRTSRTENRWMLMVSSAKNAEELLSGIQASRKVKEAEIITDEIDPPINSTNSKKGKSTIKN